MDAKVMQHVEESLNEVRAIFLKAATRIEAIKPGDKIPATKLAEELAAERGETCPQIYPTLKILLDGFPGVLIRRGAHGGIYRPTAEELAKTNAPVDTAKPSDDNVVVEAETA
jgi:hypothetical protein